MKRAELQDLLRKLSQGDKDGIVNCLRRAAASEARAGKHQWGNTLEGYAASIERRAPFDQKMLTLFNPSNKEAASLKAFEERVAIRTRDEIILEPGLKEELDSFFKEFEESELLSAHGLSPQNRILLTGSPGTGKTLLAEIIANETKKPFHILRMGSLMDSLLGNTIRNIENSFNAIAMSDAVFLFDEFDALATSREATGDVGEMRRALNALLICFEHHTGPSIVIAATNRPQSMDSAFRRRFDSVWELGSPTTENRETLIRRTLDKHRLTQTEEVIQAIASQLANLSFDECEDITKRLIVKTILARKTKIDPGKIQEECRKKIG